jgi:diguanylate cyclase (GGDEF)-like protein/PAS domain S-box-containing protein
MRAGRQSVDNKHVAIVHDLTLLPGIADIPWMMLKPEWIAPGGLAALVLYQWIRMYYARVETKKREELFQIVTENAADMIALVDVKGHRLYNSPAYKRILGYSAAELGETSAFEQIHPDDRFKVLEAAREARATGAGRKLEYRIRHKDGTWRVLESIACAIRNEKGDVNKLVIVNRDVTERKRAQEQLEHNSFHDALTGLPNRRLFLDRSQRLFKRAQRSRERQYAVLFIDLDGFKTFNDTIGPALADQVIIEVGRRLRSCLRDNDTVSRGQDELPPVEAVLSRMGGDEFTILLEGVAEPTDAMRVAKRIISVVAEAIVFDGRKLHTTASVGIALITPAHTRAEDLLRDADVAMRRAKALGGSRCEVFDESMHTRAVNRLKLEAELREATAKKQFRVLYQPIVHLQTDQITSFEALLHWQHPDQGLISPDKFMAAEDTSLLISATHWLIQQAGRQLIAWDIENGGKPAISMSLNVSAKQCARTEFVTAVQSAMRESGITASRLQIEIAERVAAAQPKFTATVLTDLKRLGIGVILDDFRGNSSLNCLRQFPAQALKLSPSLVSGMLMDRDLPDTIALIILLAHKLKLKVIAEGIESARQLQYLREMGCDLGQGPVFSQALDAEAAGQFLRRRGSTPLAPIAAKTARVPN